MKKILLVLWMVQAAFVIAEAQAVSYGPSAGTSGLNGSYFGNSAGASVNGSNSNSFLGYFSGANTTTGDFNCAFGSQALYKNTEGSRNTAIGFESMYSFAGRGGDNTAVGANTLRANISSVGNTAIGKNALKSLTTGDNNTAVGGSALSQSITGHDNTACGVSALNLLTMANGNTGVGLRALYSNTTGTENTAVGHSTLYDHERGDLNTTVGSYAMMHLYSGQGNTAVGMWTLLDNNSGDYTAALGYEAGTIGSFSNSTSLGYRAKALGSNEVVIGNTNVISIGGQVSWSTFSDGRFKRNIKEDVSGLDFINKLRPVSYDVDKKSIQAFLKITDSDSEASIERNVSQRQTGFIAQEVEAVVKKTGLTFNGVDVPQNDNGHYSIRYEEFVVPLVKAVQELTTKFDEQEQSLIAQGLEITALTEKLGEDKGKSELKQGTEAVLFQNNPNPFTTDTEIKMTLPETTQAASVMVYTLDGKQLKNIPVSDRGHASVILSGNDLNAGIYLYTLIVDGKIVDTKRLVLTK